MAKLVLEENKVAFAVGSFCAAVHAIWAIIVAIGYAPAFVGWLMSLHFLSMPVSIAAFNFKVAIVLIIVTFIVGAIAGWLFASLWNWWGKQKYFKI